MWNEKDVIGRLEYLEKELEKKDIMIDVLVNEIKELRSKVNKREYKPLEVLSRFEEPKVEPIRVIEEKSVEVVAEPKQIPQIEHSDPIEVFVNRDDKLKLKKEIEELMESKTERRHFKDNFMLDEFIEYCSHTIPFNLNFRPLKLDPCVKRFIKTNMDKIIKRVIFRINELTLKEICTTLLSLSSFLSYNEKLVAAHDVILFIDNFSKIYFIFLSLFTISVFQEDSLSRAFSSIIFFQYKVDQDILKNEEKSFIQAIGTVKNKFRMVDKNSVTIEKLLEDLSTPTDVFINNKYNENLFFRTYAIRVLAQYSDWDYVYNTYIVDYLLEKIEQTNEPSYLVYLGVVTLNAYRMFGKSESVMAIFDYFITKMVDSDDSSIVSYLIIKQVNLKASKAYLKKYSDHIKLCGYNVEYLSELVLI